jgi:hypothetical protein
MDLKYIKETTYENILDDLYTKYYQGIINWGPDKGSPYYSKMESEIEEEAEKLTEEFITRNS